MNSNNTTYVTACSLATAAHQGQFRKGSKIPYITHPLRAAQRAADRWMPMDIVIALVLHDVVEDTDIPSSVIHSIFGSHIGGIVDDLTNEPKQAYANRKLWHAAAVKKAGTLCWMSATWKLFDILDNVLDDSAPMNPQFAKLWLNEKLQQVQAMHADSDLVREVTAEINKALDALN